MSLTELQLRLLFAVVVAGKSAKFAQRVIKELFNGLQDTLPFDAIRYQIADGNMRRWLMDAKSGNYDKLERSFAEIALRGNLCLLTCGPDELEEMHGIGPKTARFFILWTRPDARYAALDVHVLRWMRGLGYDAPESTPQSPSKYRYLEEMFIKEADARGKTPRELDAEIWAAGALGESAALYSPDDDLTHMVLGE